MLLISCPGFPFYSGHATDPYTQSNGENTKNPIQDFIDFAMKTY